MGLSLKNIAKKIVNVAEGVGSGAAGVALGTLRAGEGLVEGATQIPKAAISIGTLGADKLTGTHAQAPFAGAVNRATSFVDKPLDWLGKKTDEAAQGYGHEASVAYKPAQIAANVATLVPAATGIVAKAGQLTKVPKIADATAAANDFVKAQKAASPTVKLINKAKAAFPAVAGAPEVPGAAPTETPPKVTIKQPSEPIPLGTTKVSKSGVPSVDKAITDLKNHYNETPDFTGNANDVANIANGYRSAGAKLSTNLWKAFNDSMTPEEQQAIYHKLEGVDDPNLTSRAAKVAKSIKPIYDQAADVRAAASKSFNKVTDYAPRIMRNTLGGAVRGSGKLLGKIKSLSDLGNLDSVFSKSRQIGKFVGPDGKAVFGKPSELGIVKHADGTLTDAKGNPFKQVTTNTQELHDALGHDYVNKIGHVSGIYHTDTTALKARADAIGELTKNPSAHGLFTKAQVDAGLATGDVRPIQGISDLVDKEGNPLYASNADAKALEKSQLSDRFDTSKLPGKVYDAISNAATQFIVLNPIFHGANQIYQAAIAAGNIPDMGGFKLMNAIGKVKNEDILNFFKEGNHSPDYGSTMENILSRTTGGATKLNSKAMASIELHIRVGLWKMSREAGMSAKATRDNIDLFLGDSKSLNKTAQRVTIFGHYFKTMAKALGTQARHPIQQKGSIITAATLAALTTAIGKGYQEVTGNKNAYVRMPGEIGLAKDVVESGENLAKGDLLNAADIGTNRLNPVAKEIGQQAFNQDLFTGNTTTDTAPITADGHTIIPGGRAGHAIQDLIAPTQQLEKGAGGKRSPAELAANQLGINLPHAKGNPAAPKVSFLNTKGATPAAGNDPTGYQQQQEYFSSTTAAKKGMSTADAKMYDQLSSGTSKLNNAQLQSHYSTLYSNPKISSAITKQKQDYAKKTGTALDPLYGPGITDAQRQEYYHLQAIPYKGDDYNQQHDASATWLTNLNNARNKFFDDNPIPAADVSPSERIQAPTFDDQTEKDLTTASSLTGTDKAQFINGHPNLTQAYDAINKYTNDKRQADGDTPLKLYPDADPDTQQALNDYEASSSKSAWIKSNPDAYTKVQDYLTNVSLYELANSADSDKFAGGTPSQEELKSAYGLGQYDIIKNADGTYSLGDSYGTNGSGSGYSSDSAYKEARYLSNSEQDRVAAPNIHIKSVKIPKVVIRNLSGKKVAIRRITPKKVSKVKLKV